MNPTDSEHVYELLAAEQQSIQQAVHEWKAWWAGMKEMGYPNFSELELHLSRMFVRIRNHFEHEEQSGHLEHLARVGSADPNTHSQLVHEHSEILARLKGLIDRLQMYTSSEFSWGNACQEFDEILGSLRHHEEKEADLTNAAQLSTGLLRLSTPPKKTSQHSTWTSPE